LLASFGVLVNTKAQLSTNEEPVSFDSGLKLTADSRYQIPTVTMPMLDMAKIEAEDKEDEEYDMPPRFGYSHKVDYNLNNSGIWRELPNGDRLWQLNVVCPGALSVNFCYDKFWIPEGGKFFVYTTDRKHHIGAFTSKNNKGDRENIRGFATGLLYGNDVTLEYYQPRSVSEDAIISIDYVVHGYRYINIGDRYLGSSGSCHVNVNCDEGQHWQNEKKSVALIVCNGERWCTGSLINTTDLGQKPYLLTANHCLLYNSGNNNPDLYYYTFFWNYEAPGCDNISIEPSYYSTSGARIVAKQGDPDFAMLRLTEDPKGLSSYTPFYLGWDCSGESGSPGVCIHHPLGDIKKISTVASQPESSYLSNYNTSSNGLYWRVYWKATPHGHGTTEQGSSGSALLNGMHRVVGILKRGDDNCDNLTAPCWNCKFNVSWTGYNTNDIHQRLNCWLDSIGTNQQTLDGLLPVSTTYTINTNDSLYCNILITNSGQLTVQSNVYMNGNSDVIVESGGKLIINGGKLSNANLVLKPGSSLQIINDGIIETRNGFVAPVGVFVDIGNGRIL